MKISTVLVIGGAGFIGRHLLNVLANRGIRAIVPTRRRERAKHLILLPTVDVVETNLRRPGGIESLASQCDAVINLAGVLHSRPARASADERDRYGPEFFDAHVELPRQIVAACRVVGVKRLLHMSALGAAPNAPSAYQRSKYAGEQAVLGATDLAVTVFRPSVVFGPEDRFLNLFARLSSLSPVLAIACPEARFQPVYVRDVAEAFSEALTERDAIGKSYDLVGPRQYTLRELVKYVCRLKGRRRMIIGLGDTLGRMQAAVLEHLPGKLLTRDNVLSMRVPNVSTAPFPFGIVPKALEAVVPLYMAHAAPRERLGLLRHKAHR
jgi:NADH dehydrogenase